MEQVGAWLAWNSAQHGIPSSALQLFNIAGPQLVALTENEFQQRAPQVNLTAFLYFSIEPNDHRQAMSCLSARLPCALHPLRRGQGHRLTPSRLNCRVHSRHSTTLLVMKLIAGSKSGKLRFSEALLQTELWDVQQNYKISWSKVELSHTWKTCDFILTLDEEFVRARLSVYE